MTAFLPNSVGLERSDLAARTIEVLQEGRGTSADVLLVSSEGGPVIVKDYAVRKHPFQRSFGRWSLAREERAYQRLADVAAVPGYFGRLDRDALVLEHRPGILLSRSLRGRLPSTFVDELEDAVRAMHDRGVVHLDLRHRSNVLAGDDGHPVLLDFASAIFFEPRRWTGRVGRALFAWIDRRALRKWRVRLVRAAAAPKPNSPLDGAPDGEAGQGTAGGSGSSAGSRGASRAM